ncbi:MAG: hypothetical protein PUJ82_15435, partial [Spirochaetales bacterium]|nr:hypothetical protein [Spirochaetales bacterium]
WLFASQKTGFSGFRYRFIPSLRFGTGYASPYNPCHCLKLKNSKLNLLSNFTVLEVFNFYISMHLLLLSSRLCSTSFQFLITHCAILGSYIIPIFFSICSFPGYDTWGPFKLIGGKNKNHPDENDIKNAIQFYENLI